MTSSVVYPVVMPTAAQLVADTIRRQIVTGHLRDGDSLRSEPALIEQYGVSRPTLREALRILQSEALITIRRGSRGGAVIHEPRVEHVARQAGHLLQHQHTTLSDVHAARVTLEPPAAGLLAAKYDAAAAVSRLRRALADEAAAMDDARAFARASARFHDVVVELAGNKTLLLFAGVLGEIIDVQTESAMLGAPDSGVGRDTEIAHRSHRRLVKLVEDGDVDGARGHWHAHLEAIGEVLLRGQRSRLVLDLFS